jgi:K+-sensing histidine kinase KdpD
MKIPTEKIKSDAPAIDLMYENIAQYPPKANIQVSNAENHHLTTFGDLILYVSQELTMPLNQVCQHVDKVLDLLKENQDNRLDFQLNGIIHQVYRIASLAHNLVALAKQSVPTYVNLNINEIILDAIENCEQDLGKRAALILHLEETLPSIVGDPFLLTSVFQNLIRVADELAGDDAVPRLKTDLCHSKKYVMAIFETRGPAIQPRELNKLFELFQGNSILSPGTSLGLYLSKRLLEVQHCKFRIAGSCDAGNIIELRFSAKASCCM